MFGHGGRNGKIPLVLIMDKEKSLYEKDYFAKIVCKNSNGKKLLLVGTDNEFVSHLNKTYGQNVFEKIGLFERKEEGIIRTLIDFKEELKNYYIVILDKINDADIKGLRNLGLSEFENFMCYEHKATKVDWEIVKKHGSWFDQYGNSFVGGVVPGEVFFKGWNAECLVNKKIKGTGTIKIECGTNSSVNLGKMIISCNGNRINSTNGTSVYIEDDVRFNTTELELNRPGGCIKIGEGTTFGRNNNIQSCEGTIVIGKKCMFSCGVIIHETDGHSIYNICEDGSLVKINTYNIENNIEIGDYCWIGARTTILPKTKLGSGSIAGGASVLKKKYPNNCVVAGNPARVVKKNIVWGRKYYVEDGRDVPKEYICLTEEL